MAPRFASGQNVVHDRLAKNGLLDDAEFCREFGIFLHDIAFGVLFELLTLHDGSWELDEDREYQIHIKDGNPGRLSPRASNDPRRFRCDYLSTLSLTVGSRSESGLAIRS